MSEYLYTWLEKLKSRADNLSIVFLQLGTAQEPARRFLLEDGMAGTTVRKFLDEQAPPTGLIVLDKVEVLVSQESHRRLAPLRERVHEAVEEGSRFILLSRSPRVAFPDVSGSSLLHDASFIRGPRITGSGASCLPVCDEDGLSESEALSKVVAELGPAVCEALDRIVYEEELQGGEALALLTAREREALEGAGLVSPASSDGSQWNLPSHLTPLKAALADALSSFTEPQEQLDRVTSGLWQIERILRREVRSRAIESRGDGWKAGLLNKDLRAKVLERAQESAYLTARSVKALRDPLEWLSLGELLDVVGSKEMGKLGVSDPHWRQFKTSILPIRNRTAHMRNLKPGDAEQVTRWLGFLKKKFHAPRP